MAQIDVPSASAARAQYSDTQIVVESVVDWRYQVLHLNFDLCKVYCVYPQDLEVIHSVTDLYGPVYRHQYATPVS